MIQGHVHVTLLAGTLAITLVLQTAKLLCHMEGSCQMLHLLVYCCTFCQVVFNGVDTLSL